MRRSASQNQSLRKCRPLDWVWMAVVLSVAASLPAFAGCVSQRAGLEIPTAAYVVGGGRLIEYQATDDGILFLVDQRNLLASQTIKRGEIFRISGSVELGDGSTIDVTHSRLYFVPHAERASDRGVSKSANPSTDGELDSGVDDNPSPNSFRSLQELEDALGEKPRNDELDTDAVADVPTTPPLTK